MEEIKPGLYVTNDEIETILNALLKTNTRIEEMESGMCLYNQSEMKRMVRKYHTFRDRIIRIVAEKEAALEDCEKMYQDDVVQW